MLNTLFTIIVCFIVCLIYDFLKSYYLKRKIQNKLQVFKTPQETTQVDSWSEFWKNTNLKDKDLEE